MKPKEPSALTAYWRKNHKHISISIFVFAIASPLYLFGIAQPGDHWYWHGLIGLFVLAPVGYASDFIKFVLARNCAKDG